MEVEVPHPKHPIQVVARRTGLTADVIRVWERRYGAVAPSRSPSRRRLYTDADVERLILLRRATLAGRRIGDVAGLPDQELQAIVRDDERALATVPSGEPPRLDGRGPDAHRCACMAAVECLDAHALDVSLRRARSELGTSELMTEVLLPLLQEVGERWRSGTIRAYQEHLATNTIKTLLDGLRIHTGNGGDGPEVLVTTPAGQLHEIGALMAAVVAATEGWRVTYLGPNLPAEEIAAAVAQRRARAVALSVMYLPDDLEIATELRRLRELLPDDIAIVVGGRASGAYGPVLEEIGAVHLREFEALRAELSLLRADA